MAGEQPRCPVCGEVVTGLRRNSLRVIEKPEEEWASPGLPEYMANPDRSGFIEHGPGEKPTRECPVDDVDPLFDAWIKWAQQELPLGG